MPPPTKPAPKPAAPDPTVLLGILKTARLEVDGARDDLTSAKTRVSEAIARAAELGVDVDPENPAASIEAIKAAAQEATTKADSLAVTVDGIAREARRKLQGAIAQ